MTAQSQVRLTSSTRPYASKIERISASVQCAPTCPTKMLTMACLDMADSYRTVSSTTNLASVTAQSISISGVSWPSRIGPTLVLIDAAKLIAVWNVTAWFLGVYGIAAVRLWTDMKI